MKPEEKAREKIDRQLREAGWQVCGREEYTPLLSSVAVREAILKGSKEADYLLLIDGKAVGVLEAKRAESALSADVATQAENYCKSALHWYQTYEKPLPLVYLSNGEKILFKNLREPESEYQEIPKMHTAKKIADMLGINGEYAGLPTLFPDNLRECQYDAIVRLEKSFKQGKRRALLVLATGSGKTFTACMIAYRFLTYTKAKRILFLVDRNNLGLQAEGEFSSFKLTESGNAFNAIYTTERLKNSTVPDGINLAISTIQRLYSVLTGTELAENADEISRTDDMAESEKPVELGKNLRLPSDYFDYIIVDECHRSIYGRWKAVLDHFDTARIIGLTATPAPETMAFFDNNRVIDYTLEKSIVDGINVPGQPYRIKTKVTEEGAFIGKGEQVLVHENYTQKDYEKINAEDRQYSKAELNRSVIDLSQIRLVLQEYKNIVYEKLYPERESDFAFLPKTLIFALNDRHASQITEIAKEVFAGQTDNFVQKITYSSGDTDNLIRAFRTDKTFRIAVTVNLIATGTDIKPLEVVLFMRDVESESFYIQMKGRGVRSLSLQKLREVTPNAVRDKDLFYIVDAVGVTESEKNVNAPKLPDDRKKQIPDLKLLLEEITHGYIPDEYLRTLANKIARINLRADAEQQAEFAALSVCSMEEIALRFYEALNNGTLPPFVNVNEPNIERKELAAPLSEYPAAREYLMKLYKGFVIQQDSHADTLLYSGFSEAEAYDTVSAFETYIQENRDTIKALSLIYQDKREELTYSVLKELTDKLIKASRSFTVQNLWNAYAVKEPQNVQKLTQKEELAMLTNLINLVRFAYRQITQLKSIKTNAKQFFELWAGHILKNSGSELTQIQRELAFSLAEYILENGAINEQELKSDLGNVQRYLEIRNTFGKERVQEILQTLSKFMLAA